MSKIKVKINSTTSWMLTFTVTLYQGYKASKIMISGYNYGASHWYQPEAVLLGDSDKATSISVYFGYDSNWNLWVGFDGADYTGVTISDVVNGYTQITNFDGLFTISNVSSLTTLQSTITATNTVANATTATKLGTSTVGGTTTPIYLNEGTAMACTYSLNKTVPSDAVFTDTKNTAGSTDTSSKIFLIGATSQVANPQTYSDDQCYVTNGTLQTNNANATVALCANTAGSQTAGGLSLYSTNQQDVYGIIFRGTNNKGKHGYVQSDWATYFTMNSTANRGWVFNTNGVGNVASVSNAGHAVFNGSVTIGGNATNTSGARMEYNSTTQSIDFIFN